MLNRKVKENTFIMPQEMCNGTPIVYTFNCVPARIGGKIGMSLASKIINSLVATGSAFYTGGNSFNLDEILDEDSYSKLEELIFSPQAQLQANGEPIRDPDIFFQGKLMEMYMLMGYALRCNCEDFFTIIGGSLQKNETFSKMLEDIKAGKLPEQMENLLGNFLPAQEEPPE